MSRTQEMPTLEPWAIETLLELEAQADRIRTGVACRPCVGAGRVPRGGPAGVFFVDCGPCGGSGLKSTNTK